MWWIRGCWDYRTASSLWVNAKCSDAGDELAGVEAYLSSFTIGHGVFFKSWAFCCTFTVATVFCLPTTVHIP